MWHLQMVVRLQSLEKALRENKLEEQQVALTSEPCAQLQAENEALQLQLDYERQ